MELDRFYLDVQQQRAERVLARLAVGDVEAIRRAVRVAAAEIPVDACLHCLAFDQPCLRPEAETCVFRTALRAHAPLPVDP